MKHIACELKRVSLRSSGDFRLWQENLIVLQIYETPSLMSMGRRDIDLSNFGKDLSL